MNFITNLIGGLSLGGIYAMIALGYTMVYGIAKMLNFAHGDIIMVGGYTILVFTAQSVHPLIAIALAVIFCVGLGIGQGFQPVAAFNYGAKRYERVKKGSTFTLLFGTVFIGLIASLCFAFAPEIISIFRKEAEVVAVGAEALRIQCAALLFFPISVVATMLFQSIGKSVPALILSCLQSGLLFIPLCIVLPQLFGVRGIEISQPIAYVLSACVSLPMLLVFLKKLDKREAQQREAASQENFA